MDLWSTKDITRRGAALISRSLLKTAAIEGRLGVPWRLPQKTNQSFKAFTEVPHVPVSAAACSGHCHRPGPHSKALCGYRVPEAVTTPQSTLRFAVTAVYSPHSGVHWTEFIGWERKRERGGRTSIVIPRVKHVNSWYQGVGKPARLKGVL